jgi:hypothetical protein
VNWNSIGLPVNDLFIDCEGEIKITRLKSGRTQRQASTSLSLFVTESIRISGLEARPSKWREARTERPDSPEPSTRAFEANQSRIRLWPWQQIYIPETTGLCRPIGSDNQDSQTDEDSASVWCFRDKTSQAVSGQ